MSRQVSRGSAGEDQADERAGVARLSWRPIKIPAGCLKSRQTNHKIQVEIQGRQNNQNNLEKHPQFQNLLER